jgi:DNA-binding MltR family transcriptional regulator
MSAIAVPKKPIIPVETLSADSVALMKLLQEEESDLAVAVLGPAFLDATLRSMLERVFVKCDTAARLLDDAKGALGSFQTRLDCARALGLISGEQRTMLETIGQIRNTFAHGYSATNFDSPPVMELCRRLNIAVMMLSGFPEMLKILETDFRTRFVAEVVVLSQKLLVKTLSIQRLAEAPQP